VALNGTTRRAFTLAFALGLAIVLVIAAVNPAEAGRARTLGKTKDSPRPTCPAPENPTADNNCEVLGKVTGFQVRADGRSRLFRIPERGRIVAWSIDLSRPNKSERKFFEDNLGNENLGTDPTARLAILKKKGGGTFKLTKQGPLMNLSSFLGDRPTFTLTDPLRVKEGEIVAITTPTWLPNFGLAGDANDTWRASRDKGRCGSETGDTPEENEADLLKRSRPQQKVGGERSYGCGYRSARLLYWAFLDPSAGGGGGGGGGGQGGGGNQGGETTRIPG
jgi:hypothetical protein